MPKAYSMDLRVRVLADCDAGLSAPQAAAKYRVSQGFVKKLKARRRATGSAEPGRAGHRRPPALQPRTQEVRDAVRRQPDATLAELRDDLGIALSLSALCRFLKRLRLTLKKSRGGPPNKTGPT
jgi:transposase